MRTSVRRPLGIVLVLLVVAGVAWWSIGSGAPRASETALEGRDVATSELAGATPTLLAAPISLPPAGAAAVETAASAVAVGAKAYAFHVVADADGAPIGGATLETLGGTRLGKTDEKGNLEVTFRLPRILDAPRVLVRHPGFAFEFVAPLPGQTTQVRLTKGVPVQGRVVLAATGDPVAGARIVAALDYTENRIADEVTTDADGRFRIEDVRPGRLLELSVRAPRRSTVEVASTPTPTSEEVLVRLPEGGMLSGTVRDDSGRPLPGVPIFLSPATAPLHVPNAAAPHPWASVEQTITDSSGRYELDGIGIGDPQVAVARPRPFLVAASEPFTFERIGDRIERDIRVPRGGTLLVTAEGLPAECDATLALLGARLRAIGTDAERSSEASWAFQDITPDRYDVGLSSAGFPLGAKSIEVTSGQVARLAFTFRGGLVVEGRVSYADGRPAVGARVWWVGVARAVAFADGNGAFRFGGLDASPGRIVVAPPEASTGLARSFLDGVRPGGDPVRVVLGSLPRVRLLPVGLPADATVSAWVECAVFRGFADPSVGADGALDVTVDRVGQPTRIPWTADDCAPLLTEVPALAAGEVHDLGPRRFEAGRSVALRIVDGDDRPVPRARVNLHSSWAMMQAEPDSDVQGEALMTGMPSSPFLVLVTAEGHAPHLLRVPAETSGPVVLRLGAEGTLELRVTDREGTALPKTRIQLLPAELDPYDPTPGGTPEGAFTDETGVLIQRVQTGTHRVLVTPATRDSSTTVGPVVVQAGETTTLEVKLP